MADIELLDRSVLTDEGQVILAHKIGAANTFLPGGHIGFSEPARAAVARELAEELGVAATVWLLRRDTKEDDVCGGCTYRYKNPSTKVPNIKTTEQ